MRKILISFIIPFLTFGQCLDIDAPCGIDDQNSDFIYNGDLSNTAKIIVKNVGQSIDISNGFLGKTTGSLSRIYNQYKDKIIFLNGNKYWVFIFIIFM